MDIQHTFTENGDGWLDRRMATIDLQRAKGKLREEATRLTGLSRRQLIDSRLLVEAHIRVKAAANLVQLALDNLEKQGESEAA